jgi:hypothetical protein
MKKLLFLFAIVAICFTSHAQTTVSWPTGKADIVTKTDRLTSALTITNRLTFVNYGTLDTVLTITVTPVSGLASGALLFILTKSNTTGRNVTFSTGFVAPVLSGTASKTKIAAFIYNGTSWYLLSTQQED